MKYFLVISGLVFCGVSHAGFFNTTTGFYKNPVSKSQTLLVADNHSLSAAGSSQALSQGQYIGGGVVGTVVGFGLGHAIQGRYFRTGWIHTTLQAGSLMGATTYILYHVSTALQDKNKRPIHNNAKSITKEDDSYFLPLYTLYMIFLGSRIWEIVDVWILPSDIKAVRNRLQILPLLTAHNTQTQGALGLQILYRF